MFHGYGDPRRIREHCCRSIRLLPVRWSSPIHRERSRWCHTVRSWPPDGQSLDIQPRLPFAFCTEACSLTLSMTETGRRSPSTSLMSMLPCSSVVRAAESMSVPPVLPLWERGFTSMLNLVRVGAIFDDNRRTGWLSGQNCSPRGVLSMTSVRYRGDVLACSLDWQ